MTIFSYFYWHGFFSVFFSAVWWHLSYFDFYWKVWAWFRCASLHIYIQPEYINLLLPRLSFLYLVGTWDRNWQTFACICLYVMQGTNWEFLMHLVPRRSIMMISMSNHTQSSNTKLAGLALICTSNSSTPSTVCTQLPVLYCQCTHTYTHLTDFCPELPRWAGTRKVKPVWILLKQETVSGNGISWAICKSALRSRQITVPAPHHSVFYRPDALPAALPTASKHWRQCKCRWSGCGNTLNHAEYYVHNFRTVHLCGVLSILVI